MYFVQKIVGRYKYQRTAKGLQTPSSGKLVQAGQSDLSELERVAPAESADRGGIVRCVDPGVIVSGDSLIQYGSGEAVLSDR